MPRLQLHLLGNIQLIRGGEQTVEFRSEKERLLLAYLAIEGERPHSRTELAGLLWPDQPDDQAHNNLRVTLHRLRQALGDAQSADPLLDVSREAIRLSQNGHLWIDAQDFEGYFSKAAQHPHAKLSTCPECMSGYAAATVLYQGEFLQGVYPADSLPYAEWALLRREHLHNLALRGLQRLAAYHQRRGELDQALGYARRQLELEPWREEAHGQVLTLLALQGEHNAALRHYQRCRQVLMDELGVEPSDETRRLYERILASRKKPRHNLPPETTPFLGRTAELSELGETLADPGCRLLTILGPGGIGKSRLAIRVALAQVYSFLQGVYLVQLAGVLSPAEMVNAIANAVDFQFQPLVEPKTQLLNYLREKEMLLVLDNFEQLLGAGELSGETILAELLKNAPGLRLLVTSRQRLNLGQEWVFHLQGLSYPIDIADPEPEKSAAVQLFLQSARRVDHGFQLSGEEKLFVVRICQLLEGVPLAIELAAAWTHGMSPGEIAHEIEHDLGFLASAYPDLPARQRSLRATFEHSYHLLTPEEQQVLCRLSIFPVSFDRLAAEQIAGASLPILTSLSDRSLIERIRIENRGPHLRYRMHELVNQFSREKLGENPAEVALARDQHRSFYMRFLNERNPRVMGARAPSQAVEEVSGEIENIRLALDQSIIQGNLLELGRSLNILIFFYEIQGLFDEAERIFGRIRLRIQEITQAGKCTSDEAAYYLGRATMYQGWYCMRLARFDQANHLFEDSATIARHYGDLEGYGLALNSLGIIATYLMKSDQAQSYLQESLQVLSENGYTWSQAGALNNLGVLASHKGELPQAADYFQQSLDLFIQIGDDWGIAGCLNDLGDIAIRQGELELAEQRIRQGLEIRQKLNQRWRVAESLNKLGELAYRRCQYTEAKRNYQESLAILRDFGERWILSTTLASYGEVCTALEENVDARESLFESLHIAREIGVDGTAVRALLGLAALLTNDGGKEQSVAILVAIVEHPSLAHADREKATNLLSEIQANLSPEVFQTASETGKLKSLEDLMRHVLRSGR